MDTHAWLHRLCPLPRTEARTTAATPAAVAIAVAVAALYEVVLSLLYKSYPSKERDESRCPSLQGVV